MKCPKCGYQRVAGETAPDWQCPSCGVAYAKAAAADRPVRPARDEGARGASRFAKFILLLVAIGAGVALSAVLRPDADRHRATQGPAGDYAQAKVVMYSLTTCGYCNMKRAELKANGIPFVEHFIDKDQDRQRELFEKLLASGYKGGGVGTPTFEVNGTMLPNNPSLSTIRKHL